MGSRTCRPDGGSQLANDDATSFAVLRSPPVGWSSEPLLPGFWRRLEMTDAYWSLIAPEPSSLNKSVSHLESVWVTNLDRLCGVPSLWASLELVVISRLPCSRVCGQRSVSCHVGLSVEHCTAEQRALLGSASQRASVAALARWKPFSVTRSRRGHPSLCRVPSQEMSPPWRGEVSRVWVLGGGVMGSQGGISERRLFM